MPDRKYTYQVEMDLAQATAAAARLRELFGQALSPSGGPAAAPNLPAAAVQAAVKPAQELRQALEGMARVDATASVDALNDRLRALQEQIRQARNEYERMGYTADSIVNNRRSQREAANFDTYVEEVDRAAGADAAASARRMGRAINIGQRGAEFKSDQVSDYTELEKSVLAGYEDLGEKQKFSSQERRRLIELEAEMYTAELEQTRIQQELATRRRAQIEASITAMGSAGDENEISALFEQMQDAYDEGERLAQEERALMESVENANRRLAEQAQRMARQTAVDAGEVYSRQGGDGAAGATAYTQQTAITVSKASAENAERLANELRTAAQATDDLVAATSRLAQAERERGRAMNEPAIDLKRLEVERQRMQLEAEAEARAQRTAQTLAQSQKAATQTALAEAQTRLAAERGAQQQQTAATQVWAQERIQTARTEAATIVELARVRTAQTIEQQKRETAAYRAELRQQEQAAREAARMRPQFGGGGIGGALGRIDYLAGMASGGLAMYGVGQLAMNAYDSGRTGAQQLRTAETYEVMANRVGVSSARMLQAVQRASQGTIAETEAMQLSNQVMVQRFATNSTDLVADVETMVGAARRFSQIYPDAEGRIMSVQEVYSRLITFVREGNKELVDQFGISNRRIAEVLDIPIEGLAGSEAASLRWQGTLKILEEELARIGPAALTMADQIEASERRSTDAWNRMLQAMAPTTTATAEGMAFLADRFSVATGTAGLPQVRGLLGTEANYQGPDVTAWLAAAEQYDAALAQNEASARGYEAALLRLGTAIGNNGRLTGEQASELAGVQRRLELIAQGQDAYGRAMAITTEEATRQNSEIYALVVAMANYENMLLRGELTMTQYIRGLNALAERLGVVAAAAGLAAGGIEALNAAGGKASAAVLLPRAVVEGALSAGRTRDVVETAGGIYRGGRTAINPLTGQPVAPKNDRSRADDPYDEISRRVGDEQERAAQAAQREWESAAEKTQREFEKAAEAAAAAFESSLSKVPGLLGTSSVTAEDMDAAKAGTYQDKADERLRQLANEVINGVETPEDPRDWARRMGMDPNSDPKAVYSEAQKRWEDSSLFAGGANMDLIRWDVVQADRNRQAQSASGQQAILDYAAGMGLGDLRQITGRNGQAMTLTIPGLMAPQPPAEATGAGGQAAPGAAPVTQPEQSPVDQILPSAEDATAAATTMIGAIQAAFDTDYARTTLGAIGDSMAGMVHAGYASGAAKYDWIGPPLEAAIQQAIAEITDGLRPPGTP